MSQTVAALQETSIFTACGRRKYLTKAEGLRLLDVSSEFGLADAALVGLLACTGCRVSEALGVTGFQLDEVRNVVALRRLKQRGQPQFREVPVPEALMAMLMLLARRSGEGGRLWAWSRQTAWRHVKRMMRAAELEGPQANCRGLRHGFGVACVLAQVDPRVIQRWMGHARSETTAIYLGVMGAEAHALMARQWAYSRLATS